MTGHSLLNSADQNKLRQSLETVETTEVQAEDPAEEKAEEEEEDEEEDEDEADSSEEEDEDADEQDEGSLLLYFSFAFDWIH